MSSKVMVKVTVNDVDGHPHHVEVPYATTVGDLCGMIGVLKLYNIHDKELPSDVPLRGTITLKKMTEDR